jgi:mono/diheme cytochrome c family protein
MVERISTSHLATKKDIMFHFIALASLLLLPQFAHAELKDKKGPDPKPGAAKTFDFDYEFGRPIRPDETTYNMYRTKHMEEAAKEMHLSAEAVGDGMDTWHWWVGVDNPGFWEDLVNLTGGAKNYTNLRIDFLRMIMMNSREDRFKNMGLINDPDTVASDTPDQFGLKIDRMKDGTLQWDPEKFGYSSGVIGIQLFKNAKFDPKKWNAEEYLKNGKHMEPPYRVGMSCVFCHISFNPINPPKNPAEPTWDNLTSTMGNQYLREGLAFGNTVAHNSIVYQYMASQEPGTSETSRFPTDSINNPTNINSIFRLLDRLKETHVEKISKDQATMIKSMYQNAGLKLDNITGALGGTDENPTLKVPHILTDGSDSMGVLMASVRVYVNEGLMQKQWYDAWPVNPFNITRSILRGFKPSEFDIIHKWRKDPNSPWMQTERRMPNMATFLMSYDSFALKDAPTGKTYLKDDSSLLKRGKIVFAENCASCHSSKTPDASITDPAARKKAWRDLVLQDDFLIHNYLSDDERHSVTEIGTNVQRAEGSNAMAGSTWGQMSSETYKEQRKHQITLKNLYNPLTQKFDLDWSGPDAFYRTPTLVSVWATAPFFHNNSLGLYNGDPSVKGRMEAYEDAMNKLLWPEKRLGVKSMKVTNTVTSLPDVFPGLKTGKKYLDHMKLKLMELPAGTPINLMMSVNPRHFPALVAAYVGGVLDGKPERQFSSLIDRRREAGIEALERKLLAVNTVPDFIEDRGHIFGSQLSDEEKTALIEYMKRF